MVANSFISPPNGSVAFNVCILLWLSWLGVIKLDTLLLCLTTKRAVDIFRPIITADLPYILAYQIIDSDIRILAVMHTSRKWPDKFIDFINGFLTTTLTLR